MPDMVSGTADPVGTLLAISRLLKFTSRVCAFPVAETDTGVIGAVDSGATKDMLLTPPLST
jgi:hypothetical protein